MSLILYINGQRADLKSGQAIAQTRQVNDLNSLENRQASYTNKFSLPKTGNNLRLLEHLTLTGNTSSIPYQKNECSLYSESGECFVYKGWAVISDGGEDFDVVIYDGVIDLYKAIENTTLGDLSLTEINHPKTLQSVVSSWTNNNYRYILGDYNGQTTYRLPFSGQVRINADYLIPSVNIKYLWDKIFARHNFTYSGAVFDTQAFKNLWMTYPKGVLPSESTTQMLHSESYTYQPFAGPIHSYYAKYTTAQVNGGLVVPQNIHMRVPEAGSYRITVTGKLHTTSSNFPISAYAIPKVSHVFVAKNTAAIPAYAAVPFAHLREQLPNNTDFESSVLMQLQANDTIAIVVRKAAAESSSYGFYLHGDSSLKVTLEKLNITPMNFNEAFADFSTRDFFTEIVHRFGLTMFKDKFSNHYEFLTLQEVLQTTDAADWSSKFAGKESENYTYGNYAQQNWLRYNYNSKDSSYYDSSIPLDNRNLPDTKDLIKSKMYAPEQDRRSFLGRMTNIYKFWERELTEDEETDTATISYKPLDKRYYLMRSMPYTYANGMIVSRSLGGAIQYFTSAPSESYWGLPFDDIITDYYSNIGQVLNRSLIITARLYLTEADVAGFSFKKLYYFRQLSGYFIMNKIHNYVPGKLTKCELIRVALLTDDEAAPSQPSITITGTSYIMASNVGITVQFNLANFGLNSGEELIFEVSDDGVYWAQKAVTQQWASPVMISLGMHGWYTYLRMRHVPLGLISNTFTIQW